MGSLLAGAGLGKLAKNIPGASSTFGGIGGGTFGDGSNGTNFQAQYAPIQTQGGLTQAIANNQQAASGIQANLTAQANGTGPDLVTPQLQAATDANNQKAAGFLASQKGVNPALAARLAAQQAANSNQMTANNAQQLRAQQQAQAQQQLANFNLGQGQSLQSAFANQNQAINQQYANVNNANAGIAGINAQAQNKVLGGLIGGAGQAIGMAGMAHGGVVPGKAKVQGDSKANDTVPTALSPGEIVIPRSAATDPEKAKSFIEHLAKRKSAAEPTGYSKVLKSHKKLEERIKKLEKKA